MTVAPDRPGRRGLLETLLSPFAEVHPGEAATALLLMVNVFLLLTCYYIIKPVREAFILAGQGAEAKSYAAAAMVVLLLFFVPAYSALANRVSRIKLITFVSLFFVGCLVLFYFLAQAKMPYLGIVFFIWVGIFNVAIIAQFWSFSNDVYTEPEGKRLFAIIAFGSTLGAIFGAGLTKMLIEPVGINQLLLVAAFILGLCVLLTWLVDRREQERTAKKQAAERAKAPAAANRAGGFRLVLGDRYLLYIALMMLVYNFVNTNGEFILGKTLSGIADKMAAAGQTGGLAPDKFKESFIGSFYAGFFTWVNAITAFVQLFLVSRIFKWFGVRAALFFMPIIALGGYALLAVYPVLRIIRAVKIAENSADYSIQNTARQALFLPTSPDAKYKAKAAIDTFFVRMGDVLSAGLVFLGASLAWAPKNFAVVNVVLVMVWILLAVLIGREHKKLTKAEGEPLRRTA